MFIEGHTQYPEKINVRAGILENHVLGSLFIDENLNRETYFDMLNMLITESVENQLDADRNSLLDEAELDFQQDGAPRHVLSVRQWLNSEFPDRVAR